MFGTRLDHLAFLLVLAGYLLLGYGFALVTPAWKTPDEPAHFNYIAQLGDARPGFPVIEPGDYPFAKIEQVKAPGRAASFWEIAGDLGAFESIRGIEYEDHQPPAYYVLASLAMGRPVDPLRGRLFGLILGLFTIACAWRVTALLFPADAVLATGVAAFVAFLPMHLAINASVSNDPLAYLVMAAVLWVALARLLGRLGRRAFVLAGGGLFGLAILTKVSVMAPAALVLPAAEAMRWWRQGRGEGRHALATAGGAMGLGFLLGLPWLLRNMRVYGPFDPLALRAHDRVVACAAASDECQPRTADWIAERGLGDLAGRFAEFTFKSFWGVFGWMSVFYTEVGGIPIYPALALASLAALAGFLVFLARLRWDPGPEASDQRWGLALLGLSLAVTAAGYLWYNLSFVQHQGRYLFPALVPIALGFVLGLRELGRVAGRLLGLGPAGTRGLERLAIYGFALALVALAWIGLTRYIQPAWDYGF